MLYLFIYIHTRLLLDQYLTVLLFMLDYVIAIFIFTQYHV